MIPRQQKALRSFRILIPIFRVLSVACSLCAFIPAKTVAIFSNYKVLQSAEKMALKQAILSWFLLASIASIFILASIAMKNYLAKHSPNPRTKTYGWEIIAVALIICSFIIPYFSEFSPAFKRFPVSKIKSDLRTLSAGIEAYYADNSMYPTSLNFITTPIAYLTSLSPDIFSPKPSKLPCYYHDRNGWIVWSCGPDRVYDLIPNTIADYYDSNTSQPQPSLILRSYDSTNGSNSSGDIWRIHK